LFGETGLVHDPVRVGQAGVVELWPAAEPRERDAPAPWEPPQARHGAAAPRTRLAKLIARRIWRWTRAEAGARDPEAWLASKGRRLRPGDILVLVRRRNDFVEELVRELKQYDVPVAGVDRMVLTEQLAVMDLIALGRSLLLPEDDLTLATVLKGPLIGLTEEQLFDLAYGRSGSLWTELAGRARHDETLRAAYAALAALQSRADYVRPYELYAELLGRGRGRDKLLARLGPEAADPIEEFLSLALAFEAEQVPSLEGFLHWLEAGAQTVKRDMEHGGDTVRVMTVHGAKGLQAPVVFLPDTLQVPQAGRGLLWLAENAGLALWPVRKGYDGPAAQGARAAAAEAQDQEYRRLLYVAMTRAEDRLYVCGWNTRSKAPEACWYRLIERALPAVAEEVHFDFTGEIEGGWAGPGLRLATVQAAEPEAPPEAAVEPGPPAALPPWAREAAPPEPAPPRPLAPSRPSEDEPAVRSPLGPDDGLRFRRGRIVHRLLQSLPDLPAAGRAEAARRFLARPVHGLTPAQQAEILAETLAVLDHSDFAALFGPNSRAEVPIVGTIEGAGGVEVVSGQVDRLVVTDRAVLVVDFKTNRPAPRSEAEVPALYLRQMAAYRAVLSGMYPDRPIESLLLWTEGPRLMQIRDALLASHGP
jgi:ATP-dependent helicase/nuclease subunit A